MSPGQHTPASAVGETVKVEEEAAKQQEPKSREEASAEPVAALGPMAVVAPEVVLDLHEGTDTAQCEGSTALSEEEGDEECAYAPGSPTGRQGTDLMAAKRARQRVTRHGHELSLRTGECPEAPPKTP